MFTLGLGNELCTNLSIKQILVSLLRPRKRTKESENKHLHIDTTKGARELWNMHKDCAIYSHLNLSFSEKDFPCHTHTFTKSNVQSPMSKVQCPMSRTIIQNVFTKAKDERLALRRCLRLIPGISARLGLRSICKNESLA